MEQDTKITVAVAGAVVASLSAAGLALIFLLQDSKSTSLPTLPVVVTCEGSGDCPKLECANCMDCHGSLKQCVYSLNKEKNCLCVEKEIRPCSADGAPGKQVCTNNDNPSDYNTIWGKCEKL